MHLKAKIHVIPDHVHRTVYYRAYVDDYTDAPRIVRYTAKQLRKYRKDAERDGERLLEKIIKNTWLNHNWTKTPQLKSKKDC